MSDSSEASEIYVSSAASDKDSSSDDEESDEYQISFASYQLFIFLTCFGSYCLLLYNRQSFIFTLPHILADKYISAYEVGMIISAQTFTYTVSKFICSWLTDTYPPRIMLVIGLFFTGFIILAYPDQDGWPSLMLLSGANGVAQGFGWPAVTKMIRAWYPPTQFGFWFALLTSAANGISAIGPSIASILSVNHGWQTAMHIPALMAIATAPIIIFCTWDKPSDVGYEDQLTLGGAEQGHWSDLVGSDFLMLLVFSFSFLFIVKSSCCEWGQLYLVEGRGVPYYTASSSFTCIELGGIVGSVSLGAVTDFMIRRGYYFGTGRSPRMIVVQLCAAGSCLFLNTYIFGSDPETSKPFVTLVGFCMGFCLYGGIGLIGTIAIEIAPIHMTGAAHAIIGLAANVSSVIAGSPIQYASQVWDWFTAFMLINAVCMAAFIILIIGKNIPATFLEEPTDGPPKLRPLKKS